MGSGARYEPHRVLIASANPLFGNGLRNLYQKRWGHQAVVVGLTSSMVSTIQALDDLLPDLVILDYDDLSINRDEFLNHFVTGERPMQVILVSLKENGAVVVYDRRTLRSGCGLAGSFGAGRPLSHRRRTRILNG